VLKGIQCQNGKQLLEVVGMAKFTHGHRSWQELCHGHEHGHRHEHRHSLLESFSVPVRVSSMSCRTRTRTSSISPSASMVVFMFIFLFMLIPFSCATLFLTDKFQYLDMDTSTSPSHGHGLCTVNNRCLYTFLKGNFSPPKKFQWNFPVIQTCKRGWTQNHQKLWFWSLGAFILNNLLYDVRYGRVYWT
jgi:hypothetical protein